MRILYVSQYYPPEPGAPAARVSELSEAWARAGHDVTVLTGMPHHPHGIVPPEYRGRVLVREPTRGVRVVRSWLYATANRGRVRRSLSYASFAASVVALGSWNVPRPDVLIATSPQFLCAAAGRVLAQLRGVPFVFEVRDLWPESIVAVGALPAGHPVIRGLELVEERLYRDAARIVVVTDSFREKLVARGVDAERIVVIKNGVDLSRFQPAPRQTALRARLGYDDATFLVVYVGTHGLAHGLGAVLDTAKSLRHRDDIRFLSVGDGAERPALEERAAREAIDNVRFLGVLPRDEIADVYASADVCLVPLRKSELFTTVIPSKIFEILGMARPVILSVAGEARRIVEASGGGIFVEPDSASGMGAAIERLAADRPACAAMGDAGRRYVQEHFDREALAHAYLQALAPLVRGGAS